MATKPQELTKAKGAKAAGSASPRNEKAKANKTMTPSMARTKASPPKKMKKVC
jgi:hypothetical protein